MLTSVCFISCLYTYCYILCATNREYFVFFLTCILATNREYALFPLHLFCHVLITMLLIQGVQTVVIVSFLSGSLCFFPVLWLHAVGKGLPLCCKTCHDMLVMTYRHDGMSCGSLYAHSPFIYYFSRHYILLSQGGGSIFAATTVLSSCFYAVIVGSLRRNGRVFTS